MNNKTQKVKMNKYFVSQWGWEQTNVTFYKVIKETAKMVTVIEVSAERKYNAWGNYVAVPSKSDESPRWAKMMRKKIKNFSSDKSLWQDCIEINSFSNAYRWDGNPVEGTCYA